MMTTSPIEDLARAIVDDARKDRQVLRQRWVAPAPSVEIARIAETLARYPTLISGVEKHIAAELERLGTEYAVPSAPPHRTTPEKEPADADRQTTALPDV